MLSINKLLPETMRYSSYCGCNKPAGRRVLRFSQIQNLDRRRAHTVPEQYIVDKKDAEKYQLPPKIRALKKYLTYSEYVERRKLSSGYKINKITIGKLRAKAVAHNQAKASAPVYSVMLKHLNKTPGNDAESETQEQREDVEKSDKLLHMPYAATDAYDSLEVPDESESQSELSDLNLKYRLLYEKYLKEKDSERSSDLPPELRSENEDRAVTRNITGTRPTEVVKNVPPDWMNDYEQFDDSTLTDRSWKSHYGTADPKMPVSKIPCGGCGALLHCKDPAIPGYLPSELFANTTNQILKSTVCQRCHFMKYYETTLEVKVSPEDYPALLSHIKKKKVAVILMVDLTDFPCSIWPGIMDIIGKTTNVYVVGNKIDLLPKDDKHFLDNVKKSLMQSLNDMGITKANIKGVNLISAKTGYGVEQLINKLHKHWEYKGDVYMIGCTNVGKSSLFNALLGSDYCRIQVANLIQRATVSPWPGTTLNLLKFPILHPLRSRIYDRFQRLRVSQQWDIGNQQFRDDKLKDSRNIKYATLRGYIGKSFVDTQLRKGPGFFGIDERSNRSGHLGFNENDDAYKNSRWCYDTPGTIHPDQVLHLLTTEELMMTLPQKIISPRTFMVNDGYTLFVAGLGRLDFIGGCHYIKCTVFASDQLPVTMCKTIMADDLYKELLDTEALGVPINDPERLKIFPPLSHKDFEITGIGGNESAADVVLSSAGWVAVTLEQDKEAQVRAWTPEGRGIYLRTPAMLSKSVSLKGFKIPWSPAYTRGKQVYFK